MSKTAADVKKGLAMCSADECHGQHTDCPYHPELMCIRNICGDSLVLIQQPEADKQQLEGLLAHMNQLRDAAAGRALKMEERVHQLEAERDAAVDGLKSNCTCPECKYFSDDIQEPCRGCKPNDSKFEWRGVQKEESTC